MASDEDADIDEIEEELARVEEQIQELDREDPPEPEAPDPEPDDVEAPEPEEAFEGEPDVDEDPGLFASLKTRLREARDTGDEDEDVDDQDENEATSEEAEPDTDEAPPEDPAEEGGTETPAEEDEGGSGLAFWRADEETEDEDVDGDEASPEAASDEELEDPPQPEEEPADDEGEGEKPGVIGGVLGRLRPDDEDEATTGEAHAAVPATHGAARQAPPPTGPTAAAGRAHPAPPEAAEPDEEEGARASALLARFQGGGSGDPDPGQAADDEDDDDGGLLVPVLVALLLLAGIAAAAYVLWPSDDEDLSANLVADAFTDDEGRYVATTGQPILLDASGSAGDVDEYVWNFDDGTQETTSEPTVDHTYQQRGSYTVEVTIESSGGTDTATIDVQIIEAPTADAQVLLDGEPAAQPGTIGNNVFVGDQVTLDGTGSTADAEHTLTSYTWDVDGDGETDATGREAQLGFEGVGAWAVNLTVRDDLGNEATTTRFVHVSDRLVAEGTLGPSTTEADTENHTVSVDQARLGARPVQLDVQLTYNASGDGGDLPVQPEIDPDLDLNVTDADGNEYEVEDDDGQGEETLTLPAEELTSLGDWTITVSQDTQTAGTASEAEYELVVEVVY